MMEAPAAPALKKDARQKLLEAALMMIRERGYSSTSVEALCLRAGVTKGAFFHHFESKQALAVAAARCWSELTGARFKDAPYHRPADPLQRVFAYVEHRKTLLCGEVSQFTCLVGTMVQEAYGSSPEIREACEASISAHAATLEADIASAIERHGIRAPWTAASLALHTQAVIQGAFILAKAKGSAAVAAETIDHLRCYLELLFNVIPQKIKESS
jgi:TetR/AcrR family transcriptional repressor of nem operon